MIKVTLEFKSVDEAIITLGKLVEMRNGKPVLGPAPESLTEPLITGAPPATRRSRADKGQKRGSYKNVAASDAPQGTTAETAGAAVPAVQNPGLVPAPTAATPEVSPGTQAGTGGQSPAPAVEEVQAVLEKLFNAKGANAAIDLLSRFGCKRGRDLLPEQRAEFIAEASKVTA
jgi:hypothetical protein